MFCLISSPILNISEPWSPYLEFKFSDRVLNTPTSNDTRSNRTQVTPGWGGRGWKFSNRDIGIVSVQWNLSYDHPSRQANLNIIKYYPSLSTPVKNFFKIIHSYIVCIIFLGSNKTKEKNVQVGIFYELINAVSFENIKIPVHLDLLFLLIYIQSIIT